MYTLCASLIPSALSALVTAPHCASRAAPRSAVVATVADGGTDEAAPIKMVSLQCPPSLQANVLSDALMEAGAMYVSVSDGNEGTEDEQPIFARHSPGTDGQPAELESWDELLEAHALWSNSTLQVGFASSADVERAMLSVLTTAGLSAGEVGYSVDDLAPKDWVVEVQSNWPPIALPGCLTIRFPWHSAEDVAAATTKGQEALPVITLHPGMAFGTGEHATTQLCCAALKERLAACAPNTAILDYGAGSGILSFAALEFGAASAVGVEIDVEALHASRLNAEENGVAARFAALTPEEEAARAETYPLVVANILAGTLVELAELIASRVAPGGALVLSGVWGEYQVERVSEAYAAQGFGSIDVDYAEGGWAILQATRPDQ